MSSGFWNNMLSYLLWIVFTVITTYYFLKWFYGYIRREYYFSKFKIGPPALPFPIGNFFIIRFTDERLLQIGRKLSLDYYPMYKFRAGPLSILNLIGPEEIEDIVSTTKHMEKNIIYDLLAKWLGNGLLLSSGSKWQTRRKILTPAFHFQILQKFVHVFNAETQNLVFKFIRKCGDQEFFEMDVVSSITEFALCSITETSMGMKLDMQNKKHKEYKEAIHEFGKYFIQRFVQPLFWNDNIYYNWTFRGSRELNIIKTLHSFTRNIINKKSRDFVPFLVDDEKNSYSRRKTMALLDILLNAKFKDGCIDDCGIQEEVDTFMFEGHDTTSMAICFALMLLANNPEHQTAVFEEIQQILGDKNQNPSIDELNDLKVLERCIKETLRLYPSVHFIARLLSEDWTTKSGYKFGKGTMVHIHIFDLHRNPNLYENPSKFDPDRFLPENVKKRHPFAYLPFSAGPRNCIGQRYAILEMKAVICGILQKFRLEPVDTPETIILVPNMILKSKHGIKVKFVKR